MASVGDDCVELTRSQLSIWTGQRLQPGEPLYNMILAFEIDGAIDTGLFRQAFQKLVDCCDALRIVIRSDDTTPRQCVLAHFPYDVEIVDFSADRDPRRRSRDWIDAHRLRSFDLDVGLFESALLKLRADRFIWYFNQHHLATDASSTALLFRQMQALYALAHRGALDEAAVLPAFLDHVREERAHRGSPAVARAQAFWDAQLAQPLQASTFYRESPVQRSGRTERRTCALGKDLSDRLRALAQTGDFRAFTEDLARFQLFATLLFAYLHRMTGRSRLAIGTPTHNRVSPRLKATPGMFIEVFPLRIAAGAADTFRSLHAKVADATRELLTNTAPGVCSVEHTRAFDVVLNYITVAFGDFAGLGVRSQWVHAGYGDRNHLMRLQVHDFDLAGDFVLHFDLNTDTFVGDERARAEAHFLALLRALLDNPDARVAAVPLLSPAERLWLRNRNATARPDTGTRTVVAMFRAQVAARPQAAALVCGDDALSFGGLHARIERFARRLRRAGVGRGSRVALFMPRSIDAVVGVFAVLECGAAYVPVDPALPMARVASMLGDAQAVCVLTLQALCARVPAGCGPVLCTDVADGGVDGPLPAAGPEPGPDAGPGPGDPCYLIYTSGSTGRPKGVVVHHAGLANYIDWAGRYYLGGERLDFALFSNLAFDLTVTSLFVPLTTGNRLVIYPDSDDRPDSTLRRVVEENRVGILKLTPAHLALLQTMDLSASRIRKLVVGGEDLKTDLVRSVLRRFGGAVEIYNEYGPTEGTVACMVHRVDPARVAGTSVPIGRPIDNLQVHLLDAGLQPVPRGVVGEIHIGGAGVADGYWGDPGLTANRFPPDPFVGAGRLYATGDLARWDSDGVMRFLGRRDHQVKIRGVRIELAEIEGTLLGHPGIDACVVGVSDRTARSADPQSEPFCRVCGLSGRHPDARLDAEQVCAICRDYAREPDRARGYFGSMSDLQRIVDDARATRTGKYDSLALLSGGKDSSYALCKLVEMGLRPLVFTLDNGYISAGAKANIRRLTDSLGLDLHVGSTPAMNAIFVDSLNRHSNVCNGCFKTIYTLSMQLARELGIRVITTGLSRGQIFETRLADLFRQRVFEPADIDRLIIEARKAYHRLDDVIARELDTAHLADDAIFDEIRFVDFYRYCDVSLDEIYRYLDARVGWVRPADTGRSTNCLINEAGIFVHKTERGYHNYALPYSWDVRLGHKQRDAAREELDDHIDVGNVTRILAEIGYRGEAVAPLVAEDRRLAAYYVAGTAIPGDELRHWLSQRLPREVIPAHFVHLDALPLTRNGKVDREALPDPQHAENLQSGGYAAPVGDVEQRLATLWAEVIGLDRVGRDDNFFDLGGDSILNIQIVSHAKRIGLALSPQQIFDHPTVAALAAAVGRIAPSAAAQGTLAGPVPLTPIQRRFFQRHGSRPQHCNQAVLLELPPAFAPDVVRAALQRLLNQHDGLRSRFAQRDGEWRQRIAGTQDPAAFWPLDECDLSAVADAALPRRLADIEQALHVRLDLERGPLLRAAWLDLGGRRGQRLLLVAHHLLVDGVSWWVLLEDLQAACEQLVAGGTVVLPPKTTSLGSWAQALADHAQAPAVRQELDFWLASSSVTGGLPRDLPGPGADERASERTVSRALDAGETAQLLQQLPRLHSTQVTDVLLTALAQVLAAWSGRAEVCLDVEGHGREEQLARADLSRTVGWLTSLYPVRLRCDPGMQPDQALLSVQQQLRALPNRGIGYGVLRYLCDDERVRDRLAQAPDREVLFNYLGQWKRPSADAGRLRLARPLSLSQATEARRTCLFAVDAVVFDGRLRIDWSYSTRAHRASTVARLIDGYLARLRSLLALCHSADGPGLLPSDFPHADLDQEGLDQLLAEFDEE